MDFIQIISIILNVVALISLIIPLFNALKKIKAGERCQLRSQMLTIYYDNKESGKIRQYEFENFVRLYDAYKALGGNSFIDKINVEVTKWEIIL